MIVALIVLGPSLCCPVTPANAVPDDAHSSTPAVAFQAAGDDWIAEDKLQHFTMSFAATAFAYAGARTALDSDAALISAGVVALAAGIGKEIHDARRGQHFCVRDLVWDAAGVALGIVFAHQIR